MEFVNFNEINDDMHRITVINEIVEKVPMITAMYDDICATLGCYKPMLDIEYYPDKAMCNASLNGTYIFPGIIRLNLIDNHRAAYYHGRRMNINNMDTMFKAEIAHTIIHEISHSMQGFNIYPDMAGAYEWANEKNVWDNLYPILAPMLKKKYKINLYTETADLSCGRIYNFRYAPTNSFNSLIDHITRDIDIFDGDAQSINGFTSDINNATKIVFGVDANSFGFGELSYTIKDNGKIIYNTCDALRTFLCQLPEYFSEEVFIDSNKDRSIITIILIFTRSNELYNPFV